MMIEKIQHPNQILELRLNRPPVNALNPELISKLDSALQDASGSGASALILSGRPGLFSAGLDVPELLTLNEAGMRDFWQSFFALLARIARSELLIVAALTGHSPAGGTVLALFADYRIQAKGDFRLGLNEVEVGLVVPPVIYQALVRLLGAYRAERHLVAGKMIPVDQALAIGLVDEIVPADQVLERSVTWLQSHLAMPPHSLQATRQLCRAELAALFDDPEALDLASFVNGWFDPQTQRTLKSMVERLKRS